MLHMPGSAVAGVGMVMIGDRFGAGRPWRSQPAMGGGGRGGGEGMAHTGYPHAPSPCAHEMVSIPKSWGASWDSIAANRPSSTVALCPTADASPLYDTRPTGPISQGPAGAFSQDCGISGRQQAPARSLTGDHENGPASARMVAVPRAAAELLRRNSDLV